MDCTCIYLQAGDQTMRRKAMSARAPMRRWVELGDIFVWPILSLSFASEVNPGPLVRVTAKVPDPPRR